MNPAKAGSHEGGGHVVGGKSVGRACGRALVTWLATALFLIVFVDAAPAQLNEGSGPRDSGAFERAQRLFYNGRYLDAAAEALEARAHQPDDLATFELRTSALLFQVKQALAVPAGGDRRAALRRCEQCAEWTASLLSDVARGQTMARARLEQDASDESASFALAKLDLNYLWLHLEWLGRRTGWSEYWEARKSLDSILAKNPDHVRARVARAWIDYIVGTRMPGGTRWVLGGGNRRRALQAMRQAADAEADFFVRSEASFALWDMEMRERNVERAVEVARGLARDFPENQNLIRFLDDH